MYRKHSRFVLFCFCFLFFIFSLSACGKQVQVGAEQTDEYLPILQAKRVALLSNHTGVVYDSIHILDHLLANNINVTAVFSPEHGFRGTAGAGDHVANSIDEKTGIPILSLYNGSTPRPSDEAMQEFDVLVIDIQDVGLRFYTYYITMVRLMDACADFGKQVVLLDRPNPNGHYVDGPLLDMKFKSGVGYLPIPVVHGMTLGELALMVNGEGWLPDGKQCDITVVRCKNYTHKTLYRLPIPPSPNLRNMLAIYLYPSTCYFEATPVSLGRGTDLPFLCYGHPLYDTTLFVPVKSLRPICFTPRSVEAAPRPPQQDKLCYGVDLSGISETDAANRKIDLSFLIDAYSNVTSQDSLQTPFFTAFFEKLIGVDYIREMIEQGKTADQISSCWQNDVEKFKEQRRPYLLYEE